MLETDQPSPPLSAANGAATAPNGGPNGGPKATDPNAPPDSQGEQEPGEIKDPSIIFNTVWNKLEAKYGRENMRFPQEIIWLGGAPGAGKGTNTPFIASVRGITAAPIVMSSLLDTPEARRIKSQGGLVSDSYVFQLILEELRRPIYRSGVVVDGFPRTTIQVECTNMLYERMLELRKQFYHTPLGTAFPRPIFRVTVLFIEEHQSVERQLKRGIAIREQNKRLRDKNLPLLEERDTDASPEAGRKRYKIFRDHYSTLQTLKKHFPFTLIDASGTIEEVQQNIIKEFKYQSSLELSQETYDMVQRIPLVSDVIMHARGDLVARLDEYQYRHAALFEQVIQVVEREFVPVIRRHAIAGIAFVRTMDSIFQSDLAIEMVLDVLSERGYHVLSDMKQMAIPDTLDQETGKIISVIRTEYQFQVRFQHPEIRDIFNNQKAVKMQLQK